MTLGGFFVLFVSGIKDIEAEETLVAAKICFQNRLFKDCINRSYYVAFYSAGSKKILAWKKNIIKRRCESE